MNSLEHTLGGAVLSQTKRRSDLTSWLWVTLVQGERGSLGGFCAKIFRGQEGYCPSGTVQEEAQLPGSHDREQESELYFLCRN